MHATEFVHRDVKPDNFCINKNAKGIMQVMLIDFGLSKRFISPQTCKHVELKTGKATVGTLQFLSHFA